MASRYIDNILESIKIHINSESIQGRFKYTHSFPTVIYCVEDSVVNELVHKEIRGRISEWANREGFSVGVDRGMCNHNLVFDWSESCE